jgi:hypothetical protein
MTGRNLSDWLRDRLVVILGCVLLALSTWTVQAAMTHEAKLAANDAAHDAIGLTLQRLERSVERSNEKLDRISERLPPRGGALAAP